VGDRIDMSDTGAIAAVVDEFVFQLTAHEEAAPSFGAGRPSARAAPPSAVTIPVAVLCRGPNPHRIFYGMVGRLNDTQFEVHVYARGVVHTPDYVASTEGGLRRGIFTAVKALISGSFPDWLDVDVSWPKYPNWLIEL